MVQPMGFDPGGIGRAIEVTDTFQTREAVAHMTRSLGAWELSDLAGCGKRIAFEGGSGRIARCDHQMWDGVMGAATFGRRLCSPM